MVTLCQPRAAAHATCRKVLVERIMSERRPAGTARLQQVPLLTGPPARSRSAPGAQDQHQSRNITFLLVIALFSSQFELENASRGVNLSMDLSVARGRPRAACG